MDEFEDIEHEYFGDSFVSKDEQSVSSATRFDTHTSELLDIDDIPIVGHEEASHVVPCPLIESNHPPIVDGRIARWGDLVERHQSLLDEADPDCTFTDTSRAERIILERNERAAEWAKSTVLLTFTGRTHIDTNSSAPWPPVTHFQRLQASVEARQKAQSRVLEALGADKHWSATVLCVNRDGYLYVQKGLYLPTTVSAEQFRPVITAHVNNCEIAEAAAHDEGAVTVHDFSESNPRQLIKRLAHKAPGLADDGHTDWDESLRRGAAVIEAGGLKLHRYGSSR